MSIFVIYNGVGAQLTGSRRIAISCIDAKPNTRAKWMFYTNVDIRFLTASLNQHKNEPSAPMTSPYSQFDEGGPRCDLSYMCDIFWVSDFNSENGNQMEGIKSEPNLVLTFFPILKSNYLQKQVAVQSLNSTELSPIPCPRDRLDP